MAVTTTQNVIDALADPHLKERLVAAAAIHGQLSPNVFVENCYAQLMASPVSAEGDTIASIYAYALATAPPPPGKNPAAVTDAHLNAAIQALM